MLVRFTVPGEPKGKARHVVTKHGAFTPGATVAYENLVKYTYASEIGQKFPDGSMLRVDINAYYTIPKSASKKKQDAMMRGKIRPTKKPDWDNVGKIVCDALNGIAYHDDAQVVSATVEKFYCDYPRVDVVIEEI